MASGPILEFITFGGYTFALGFHEAAGLSLMTSGCAMATYHARDLPDRPVPNDRDGVPIPDTDAPHTQLGTKESKSRPGETYPQAREFDKNGKPVKNIDFTDHGRPQDHPNPHEHLHEDNPSGGTPKRGNPEPLEHWKY